MQAIQLHDGKFLKILWDEQMRVIGIDWKEATAAMADEGFKAELTLFHPFSQFLQAGPHKWSD